MITQSLGWLAGLPAVADIALKGSVLLVVAWSIHILLLRRNPRWRVMLWRGTAVALVLTPLLVLRAPLFEVPISAPQPPSAIISDTTHASLPTPLPVTAVRRPEVGPIGLGVAPSAPSASAHQPAAPTVVDWTREHSALLFVGVWAVVASLLAFRVARATTRIRRIVRASSPAPEFVKQTLRDVANALGCGDDVALLASPTVSSPFLAGARSPVIVLPARMIDRAYARELPAILAHELAHLRSRDIMWSTAICWLESVLWLHPLVWPLRSAHASACEEVCDAVAADYVGDTRSYSGTLASVALQAAGRPPSVIVGIPMARHSDVRGRLEFLRRKLYPSPLARRWVALWIVLALATVGGFGGLRLVYAEPASQDGLYQIRLTNGTTVRGEVVSVGPSQVRIRVGGSRMTLPRERIVEPDLENLPKRPVKMTARNAQIAESTGGRIVHFPKDRSLGILKTLEADRPRITATYHHWVDNHDWLMDWKFLSEARGDVIVPDGELLGLQVSVDGAKDLAPLSELAPDDLHTFCFLWPREESGKTGDSVMPHISRLTGLRVLNLEGTRVSDRGLRHIAPLQDLDRLYLTEGVSGAGMAHVSKLKSLTGLHFNGKHRLRDSDLALLARLERLEELSLCRGGLSSAGLGRLAQLTNLSRLRFWGDSITDDIVAQLKGVSSLKNLNLAHSQITDAGLSHVSAMTGLEILALYGCNITDKGLAHLGSMPSLKMLNLSGCPPGSIDINNPRISDAGMAHLKRARTLERLDLPNTGISDKGLAHLSELSNLRSLSVGLRTGLSGLPNHYGDEGVKSLAKLRRLETLRIGGPHVTDAAMPDIASLSSLRELALYGCPITREGLSFLTALKSLEGLSIHRADLKKADLAILNQIPSLVELSVTPVGGGDGPINIAGLRRLQRLELGTMKKSIMINDEDMASLAGLSDLRQLTLWEIKSNGVITDAGMKHLSGLTAMERLSVGGPGVTDRGLECLSGMTGLWYLNLRRGSFGDQSLKRLEELKSLKTVSINSYSTFSPVALARLRRSLPALQTLNVRKSSP